MTAATGPSRRGTEIAVALLMALFGGIAILGSLQVGIDWGAEGPKSGFFPFYLGVVVIIASVANLASALRRDPRPLFAEWSQLRKVVSVVIPTALYVALIPLLGLYACSFVLIVGFMLHFGRYSPPAAAGLAASVIIVTYVTFERWFLVPLPKGPIEELLGL